MKTCNSQIVKEYFDLAIDSDYSKIETKYRNLILDAKQYMKEELDETFDKIRNRDGVFVSDLFFKVFFNAIFRYKEIQKKSRIIIEFIDRLRDKHGGCKPCDLFQYDWQNKSRIYSTYYSLILLKLIGVENEFLKNRSVWCAKTYTWLCQHQLTDGDNIGSFVELDSPSTIVPENTYWAISSLELLLNFVPFKAEDEYEKLVKRSVNWIYNNFLLKKRKWSVTRLYYALNLLKTTNMQNILTNKDKKAIMDFLRQVHYAKGFQEFHVATAKAGYRKEKTHEFAFIHSTFHALQILKLLGKEEYNRYLKEAKELVQLHKHNKGFGVQITVKDYNYGPCVTPYETLCATLILLS